MPDKLSKNQAGLIECFKFLKLNQEAIVTIMLLIPKDDQIAEMAEFLLENPEATEPELLKKAVEISDNNTNDNIG